MDTGKLEAVAAQLVAPGKGILASDESFATVAKKLEAVGVDDTAENRRLHHELYFTTPGSEKYLSGVILFAEAYSQRTEAGEKLTDILDKRGMLHGIKVDQGRVAMPNSPDEMVTMGLDGLPDRLRKYAKMGANFAKWRSSFAVTDELPSESVMLANAHGLALYAAMAQAAGLVPIVEPEVLMQGDHTSDRCEVVLGQVLRILFEVLDIYGVHLGGLILKTSMVVPGDEAGEEMVAEKVAKATVSVLKSAVPEQVPGVVFLSGGQTPDQATVNLNEIVKQGKQSWELTFSFSRALEDEALELWRGVADKWEPAQEVFMKRLELVAAARRGELKDA